MTPRSETPPPPAGRGRDDFAQFVAAVKEALRIIGGAPGHTPNEVGRIMRVSPSKVLTWIAKGELVATNTATNLSGKPRWVIAPEALAAFRARRTSAPLPQPPKRRRRASGEVDFFPD